MEPYIAAMTLQEGFTEGGFIAAGLVYAIVILGIYSRKKPFWEIGFRSEMDKAQRIPPHDAYKRE